MTRNLVNRNITFIITLSNNTPSDHDEETLDRFLHGYQNSPQLLNAPAYSSLLMQVSGFDADFDTYATQAQSLRNASTGQLKHTKITWLDCLSGRDAFKVFDSTWNTLS